jgi:hypothetical protein
MRKAKASAEPGTLPSDATLLEWFLLPLAPTRREANSGVPIVIPVGGKRVLAQIAWPHDDSRQARFVKAGRRNAHRLSREEYLQLADTDSFWMNDGMIDDLLAEWAIRAAKSEPELAKHSDHFLRLFFVEQLVDFVLGRPLLGALAVYRERVSATRDPQKIVRRYLLSESWKRTVELLDLERRYAAPRRKGTKAWVDRRRLVYAEIRAAAENIKHPLVNRSQTSLIDQTRIAPELADKKSGKPLHSRSTVRRALAKSKAEP